MDADVNPYATSARIPGEHGSPGTLLFRIVAISCWLAALLPIMGYTSIVNRPDVNAKREANPPLYAVLCISMFALPAVGLSLLGIASWRRSKWLAVSGLTAILPILILTLLRLMWTWIR